jgi:hypothetical protein
MGVFILRPYWHSKGESIMKRSLARFSIGAALFLLAASAALAAPPSAPEFLAALGDSCAVSPALASVFSQPVAPGLTPAPQPDSCEVPCGIFGECQSCGNGTSKPCTVVNCCGKVTTNCGSCTAHCVPLA